MAVFGRGSVRAVAITALLGGLGLTACDPVPVVDLVVDSPFDAGDAVPGDGFCATAADACTLRAAVQEANALPGRQIVHLAPGETYQLALDLAEADTATGDLDITGVITIEGRGATVDASPLPAGERVMEIGGGAGTDVVLDGLVVTGGEASSGAAVAVTSGALAIVDSTVTANGGTGSAVSVAAGARLVLANSTVADNTTPAGIATAGTTTMLWSLVSGHATGVTVDGGSVDLRGTIVADNTSDCAVAGGALSSSGWSLDEDGSCGLAGPTDVPATDPMLEPLGDDGGPTPTRMPRPGSPVVDAAGACPVAADQRGESRPVGVACDIGPVEGLGQMFGGSFDGFFAVDTSTGAFTLAHEPSPSFLVYHDLAYDSRNHALYLVVSLSSPGPGFRLATLDLATGETTLVGTVSPIELEYIYADDALYGLCIGSTGLTDVLCEVDRATGAVTVVGPTGVRASGLAYDSAHDVLYGTGFDSDSLYTVDRATGAFALVGPAGVAEATDIGYDPVADVLYGLGRTASLLYTVDRETGGFTLVGPTGADRPHALVFVQ
jgi:hypothetical protein